MSYGDSQALAITSVQVLAARVIADRIEDDEAVPGPISLVVAPAG